MDLENNKMKENWGMNSFYVNLQDELAEAKEELWAQTQIDGAEAGKKTLLKTVSAFSRSVSAVRRSW